MFAAVAGHEKLRLHVAKLDEIDTDSQLAEAIKVCYHNYRKTIEFPSRRTENFRFSCAVQKFQQV